MVGFRGRICTRLSRDDAAYMQEYKTVRHVMNIRVRDVKLRLFFAIIFTSICALYKQEDYLHTLLKQQ